MKNKKALLVVDVQNDFCPGGALGVPQGDKIIPVINKYIRFFSRNKLPVIATRDWHPPRTTHFKDFGGKWPAHCIKSSPGAAFHPALKLSKDSILLYKGMDPDADSYSAFDAEDLRGASLLKILTMMSITEIYIAGLATDYCVKSSAIDAIRHGFKVRVLVDAVKGVNLKAGDSEKAIEKIVKMGAKKLTISKLLLPRH